MFRLERCHRLILSPDELDVGVLLDQADLVGLRYQAIDPLTVGTVFSNELDLPVCQRGIG